MACFADINVSQGSVATCASCGGIFNILLTAKITKETENISNRLRFDRIIVMSLWPCFLAHPVWFICPTRVQPKGHLDRFVRFCRAHACD